jgi:hypothetical protein
MRFYEDPQVHLLPVVIPYIDYLSLDAKDSSIFF